MRVLSASLVAATLLWGHLASAADAGKDKGTTLESVRTGPAEGAVTAAPTTGAEGAASPNDIGRAVTTPLLGPAQPTKKWEVGISVEYHRLIIQNDLEGAAVNKNVVYWAIYGKYDLTKNDSFRLSWGMYERFLADQGEPGVQSSDLSLLYSHGFHLPWGIGIRLGIGTIFPTSLSGELSGLITAPGVLLSIDKAFGSFDINLRGSARYFFDKYTTSVGGNPNTQADSYLLLTLEYKLPRVPLSVGVDVYTEYAWLYNLSASGDPNPAVEMYGATSLPGYSTQPVQQLYGGEVYLRYDWKLWHLKGDATIAYANGDPTLGYNSLLHDGGVYFYPLFWRLNSEVYGAVSARF